MYKKVRFVETSRVSREMRRFLKIHSLNVGQVFIVQQRGIFIILLEMVFK